MGENILLNKADNFAFMIYKISKNFPKEEMYGLTSQIRRSAISVPLNIIEGFARQNKNEYRRFLEIAYGSLKETKYLLYFAQREKFIKQNQYKETIDLSEEIGKLIWSTTKTLKSK
jgi:four helix bundle protein